MATNQNNVPTSDFFRNEREEYAPVEQLFNMANTGNVPTGILHWSPLYPYQLGDYDGTTTRSACDPHRWRQFYLELHSSTLTDEKTASPEQVDRFVDTCTEEGVVPIFLAHYTYNTPKKFFVGRVLTALKQKSALPLPDPEKAEDILDEKRDVFAAALLPQTYIDFSRQPAIHYGLTVKYVLPQEGYLTNVADEISDVAIDFDDGKGFRPCAFDEIIEVSYQDAIEKSIKVRFTCAHETFHALFHLTVAEDLRREPDETWPLEAAREHQGVRAKGTAWVVYGNGNTALTNPVIMADGFGSGATNFNDTWRLLNANNLATDILAQGKDLIV